MKKIILALLVLVPILGISQVDSTTVCSKVAYGMKVLNNLGVDGNVGIGVKIPSDKLEVAGNAIIGRDIITGITTLKVGNDLFSDGALDIDYDNDNNRGRISIAGDVSPKGITIANNGNIGINVSIPSTPLDVAGIISSRSDDDGLRHISISQSLKFKTRVESNSVNILGYNAIGQEQIHLSANGNSWLKGGNVGIGESSPDEKLEVSGNIHASGNIRVDNNNNNYWGIVNTGTGVTDIKTGATAATNLAMTFNDNISVSIYEDFFATEVYNVTTASAGNVFVESNGQLKRSTSSARYKRNIRELDFNPFNILKFIGKSFESPNDDGETFFGWEAEQLDSVCPEMVGYMNVYDSIGTNYVDSTFIADYLGEGIQTDIMSNDSIPVRIGVNIREKIGEIPDWVMYERGVVLLNEVVKTLRFRNNQLKNRVDNVELENAALRAELDYNTYDIDIMQTMIKELQIKDSIMNTKIDSLLFQ